MFNKFEMNIDQQTIGNAVFKKSIINVWQSIMFGTGFRTVLLVVRDIQQKEMNMGRNEKRNWKPTNNGKSRHSHISHGGDLREQGVMYCVLPV